MLFILENRNQQYPSYSLANSGKESYAGLLLGKLCNEHESKSEHRWMDDLRFYVLFNSISVISGRRLDDNERLCAMELRLRLRRFHLERGSNSVR